MFNHTHRYTELDGEHYVNFKMLHNNSTTVSAFTLRPHSLNHYNMPLLVVDVVNWLLLVGGLIVWALLIGKAKHNFPYYSPLSAYLTTGFHTFHLIVTAVGCLWLS